MLAVSMLASSIAANSFLKRFRRPGMSFSSALYLSSVKPPVARKEDTPVYFGVHPDKPDEDRGKEPMSPPLVLQDPYSWMRDDDRKNPEVIAHLESENTYCTESLSRLKNIQNELYNEMVSHMKETDEDVPYNSGPYIYYSKTVKGLSYKIHCRKLRAIDNNPSSEGKEEIILDENKIAEGQNYSVVGCFDVSPDHKYLAYGVDNTGYETYTIRIINLETGEYLPDIIEDSYDSIEWGNGSIFYIKMDKEHRPYELYNHIIPSLNNDKIIDDIRIIQEMDSLYCMSISKTHDEKYLIVDISSKETSECYILDLYNIKDPYEYKNHFILVSERSYGIRYVIENHNSNLLIVTNKDNAKTNKICYVNINNNNNNNNISNGNNIITTNDICKEKWIDMKKYDSKVQIDGILPFTNHLVITGRQHGLQQIWIVDANTITNTNKNDIQIDKWINIEFPEDVYMVYTQNNKDYDTNMLRYVYSSAITPTQTIEFNMSNSNSNSNSNSMNILKSQEVPFYDKSLYECRRIYAVARDGVEVPMSLVARKGVMPDNTSAINIDDYPKKLLLIGYGSYGMCYDVGFNFKQLSLLDRGFIVATAHIRGGGEMGYPWYEDYGKYLNKMNTFNDFADCAKYLIKIGYTSSDRIGISGRSAGGLLMGTVLNRDPGLYKACIAGVPFVDVMNTMSDPSIPLTIGEWEEWGNPNEMKFHEYMKSYSPYDNVVQQEYPSMLVTAGLNDPRVAYWEPSKWIAKIRELRTNKEEDAPIYLKTEMSSGHFSYSDRYKHVKETAFEYSFLLDQIKD